MLGLVMRIRTQFSIDTFKISLMHLLVSLLIALALRTPLWSSFQIGHMYIDSIQIQTRFFSLLASTQARMIRAQNCTYT